MVGGPALEQLALQGQLFTFLDAQEFQGKKLRTYLGGWLGKGEVFRGKKVICYHKNWAYFQDRFGVTCADYVEPKPGIPPTPGHVAELIDEIKNQHIHVLFVADYFDKSKVESMARRSGATMVRVPMEPGGQQGVDHLLRRGRHVGERPGRRLPGGRVSPAPRPTPNPAGSAA